MESFTWFTIMLSTITIFILLFKKVFKLALVVTLITLLFAYNSKDFLNRLKEIGYEVPSVADIYPKIKALKKKIFWNLIESK